MLLSRCLQTGVSSSSPLLRHGRRAAVNGESPRPTLPQSLSNCPVLTCPRRCGLVCEPPASSESLVRPRCHEPPCCSVVQSRPVKSACLSFCCEMTPSNRRHRCRVNSAPPPYDPALPARSPSYLAGASSHPGHAASPCFQIALQKSADIIRCTRLR